MTPEWTPLDQMTVEELNSRDYFVCWFPDMEDGKGDYVSVQPWCDNWSDDGRTMLFPVNSWYPGDAWSKGEPTYFLRGLKGPNA